MPMTESKAAIETHGGDFLTKYSKIEHLKSNDLGCYQKMSETPIELHPLQCEEMKQGRSVENAHPKDECEIGTGVNQEYIKPVSSVPDSAAHMMTSLSTDDRLCKKEEASISQVPVPDLAYDKEKQLQNQKVLTTKDTCKSNDIEDCVEKDWDLIDESEILDLRKKVATCDSEAPCHYDRMDLVSESCPSEVSDCIESRQCDIQNTILDVVESDKKGGKEDAKHPTKDQENKDEKESSVLEKNISSIASGHSDAIIGGIPNYPTEESGDMSSSDIELPLPLKMEQFDILLLYADKDRDMAWKFRNLMKKFFRLEDGKEVSISFFDDDSNLATYVQSKFVHMELALARSTLVYFYMSREFVTNSWTEMKKDEVLQESIENPSKKWAVIPLHQAPEDRDYDTPFGLKALKGIQMSRLFKDRSKTLENVNLDEVKESDLDEFFYKNNLKMLNGRRYLRIEREKIDQRIAEEFRKNKTQEQIFEDAKKRHKDRYEQKKFERQVALFFTAMQNDSINQDQEIRRMRTPEIEPNQHTPCSQTTGNPHFTSPGPYAMPTYPTQFNQVPPIYQFYDPNTGQLHQIPYNQIQLPPSIPQPPPVVQIYNMAEGTSVGQTVVMENVSNAIVGNDNRLENTTVNEDPRLEMDVHDEDEGDGEEENIVVRRGQQNIEDDVTRATADVANIKLGAEGNTPQDSAVGGPAQYNNPNPSQVQQPQVRDEYVEVQHTQNQRTNQGPVMKQQNQDQEPARAQSLQPRYSNTLSSSVCMDVGPASSPISQPQSMPPRLQNIPPQPTRKAPNPNIHPDARTHPQLKDEEGSTPLKQLEEPDTVYKGNLDDQSIVSPAQEVQLPASLSGPQAMQFGEKMGIRMRGCTNVPLHTASIQTPGSQSDRLPQTQAAPLAGQPGLPPNMVVQHHTMNPYPYPATQMSMPSHMPPQFLPNYPAYQGHYPMHLSMTGLPGAIFHGGRPLIPPNSGHAMHAVPNQPYPPQYVQGHSTPTMYPSVPSSFHSLRGPSQPASMNVQQTHAQDSLGLNAMNYNSANQPPPN